MKILTLFCIFTLVACSSAKKEVAKEKANVPSMESRDEMINKTRDLIESSDKLTQKQKKDFMQLHTSVMIEVGKINQETRKLKMVLFKHLLEQDSYKPAKVKVIKNQLKKLNDKKFQIMIDSLKQAKEILGVNFKELYPSYPFYHGHADVL
ncbi:MAG: hypothetical protein QF441_02670 [Bacteriovoracaceae bacterium]|nr:hypothetical protein [Bacteriovoracaceae bacterium]